MVAAASGPAAPTPSAVVLDIGGRRVDLGPAEVVQLRNAAAAGAGSSSVARDLSLLLDCGSHRHRVLALRRGEAHTLAQLARQVGLDALGLEITAPAA
jgi:hypothetical protein